MRSEPQAGHRELAASPTLEERKIRPVASEARQELQRAPKMLPCYIERMAVPWGAGPGTAKSFHVCAVDGCACVSLGTHMCRHACVRV